MAPPAATSDDLEGLHASPSPFSMEPQQLNDINEEKNDAEWEKLGGLAGVAAALHTSLHDGADPDPAALEQRRAVFGANCFRQIPPKSLFWLWVGNLKDPTLIMLMAAALVSTVIGAAVPSERENNAWSEGVAIWVAVIIVSGVGAFNDWNKDKQFQKLNAQKDEIEVKVVRGGATLLVGNRDVAVGDVMLLDTGDKIVADGYVIETHGLVVDEASLTGESDPVKKGPHPREEPWVRSGTQVTEGSGRMLVTAVGEGSEWGRTMALVVGEVGDTPLQEKLGVLATAIGKIGLVVGVVCFFVLLIRWIVVNKGFPMDQFAQGPLQFFIFAVTILVVAVPEGLPLAVTISLAYSMRKMMKDNNFVRVLAACETMGGATAICSDKTGTLTENRMTVVEGHYCGAKYAQVPDVEALPPGAAEDIVLNCALNNKAFLIDTDRGTVDFVGNRTECALLVMLRAWGRDYRELRELHHADIVEIYGFSSERKMASVLVRRPAALRLYVKGAAEIVLGRCVAMVNASGETVPMAEALQAELLETVTEMASRGLRTLCLAYADFPLEDPSRPDGFFAKPHEDSLTALCIVGIKDPVRKEVPGAVQTCQKAGIHVRMVTGDNIHTACHIARECGILTGEGLAMEGPDFRRKTEEELFQLLPRLQVLARSSPQDKYLLVQTLKKMGEVVAVTGDGTNDAPALKESDVGLAMGIAGTEVAKEAADIVILDDNFSSIVKSVLWGRSVFTNIRKFLVFQLTINGVALVVAFVTAITNGETPLNVMQLLWVNLIMDSLAALALATEDPTPDLLEKKPHGRNEPLISGKMWKQLLSQACYQLFWLLLIFYGGPVYLSVYDKPNECDYWYSYQAPKQSGGTASLCCTAGSASCLQTNGGWYPAQTSANNPMCSWTGPSSCELTEPQAQWYCAPGQESCDALSAAWTAWDGTTAGFDDLKKEDAYRISGMVFNAFIFMQMFNMLNARKIEDEYNVFAGIFHSHIFWVVWVLIIGFQVIIMFFLTGIFRIERLTGLEWGASVAIGLGSLPLAFLVKFVSRRLLGGDKSVAAEAAERAANWNKPHYPPPSLSRPKLPSVWRRYMRVAIAKVSRRKLRGTQEQEQQQQQPVSSGVEVTRVQTHEALPNGVGPH